MSTLILVEHNHQGMHPSTRQVLAAALQLDSEVVLLVAGHTCTAVAEEAAALAGVTAVYLADNPCYAFPLAETLSALVLSLAPSFTTILAPASTFGKNVLPRVAALLDVTQVSDVIRIIDKQTFEHPIYAGNAIETLRVLDDKILLTIRTTAFDPVTKTQPSCVIESIAQVVTQSKSCYKSHQLSESVRPPLDQASVVVSGGRGLQSAAQFKLIESLADVLGAAVGASRAAVDAGFISNDHQVGQTGKVVAPQLYIAVGISGAVQHLAGMKDSKVIVAINQDPDAPIFQMANYGLVGDLFVLVPKLIESLRS